jgi:hypothetical protein
MIAAALLALARPAVSTSNPYEIFAATRRYWEAQRYPVRLEYTVAVSVVEAGKTRVQHYHLGYDGVTGGVVFDPVSDEEKAHPYVPPGGIGVFLPFMRIGKPPPPVDYLGVPALAPVYGFGIGRTPLAQAPHKLTSQELVAEIRAEFHDPNPRISPSPSPTPQALPSLHEIAEVYARSPTYRITLIGREDLDGAPAYHLKLVPVRDPGRYRLRELWVDAETFAPQKLVEALNFEQGPGTTVPWTVTFAPHDGALYIGRESANAPMRAHALLYTQASVEIQNVHPVATFERSLGNFAPASASDVLEEP